MAVNRDRASMGGSAAWAGWVAFAGIMLALNGFFGILQGITAITDDRYFVAANGDLLIADFSTWGWVLLIWGILLIGAGLGLIAAKGWARWLGIFLAFASAILQIGFLAAYPIWSVIVIAIDVFVLFALTARWEEARAGLSG
jgi:hypothetical protein